MDDDKDKLWDQLRDRFQESKTFKKDLFERTRPLFEQLRRVVDQDATGLEAFFETVGEGLVLAQQSLDRRSMSYSAGAGQLGFPTLFRIPKVTAQLYFSALERTGRGFLPSIITKEESEKKTTHSVSFDVVAAPPPPNVVQNALAGVLDGLFVGDLLTRRRIKTALTARVESLEKLLKEKKQDSITDAEKNESKRTRKYKDDFQRVIILRGARGWALVRVCMSGFNAEFDCAEAKKGDGSTPNADLLYVEGDLDGSPVFSFENNNLPPGKLPSRLHKLLGWLSVFADRQEEYLRRMKELEGILE